MEEEEEEEGVCSPAHRERSPPFPAKGFARRRERPAPARRPADTCSGGRSPGSCTGEHLGRRTGCVNAPPGGRRRQPPRSPAAKPFSARGDGWFFSAEALKAGFIWGGGGDARGLTIPSLTTKPPQSLKGSKRGEDAEPLGAPRNRRSVTPGLALCISGLQLPSLSNQPKHSRINWG